LIARDVLAPDDAEARNAGLPFLALSPSLSRLTLRSDRALLPRISFWAGEPGDALRTLRARGTCRPTLTLSALRPPRAYLTLTCGQRQCHCEQNRSHSVHLETCAQG
jgi:hypothetical protein